ncbi:hypothetical protein [Olivibacter jilunii]|uniref:hypothetical protein n=1 Tax=Olivibacter jilunii TaxID=985016 RepID=UPI003F1526A8
MRSFVMTDKDYILDSTFPIDAIELIKTYNAMDLRLEYGYSSFEMYGCDLLSFFDLLILDTAKF